MGRTLSSGFCRRRGLSWVAGAALLAMALLAAGRARGAEGLSDIQRQQVQLHITILSKLQAYSLEQQFQQVYGLIAKANERDAAANQKRAAAFLAKAEEVRDKNQAAVQEYLKAARAYKALAEINQKIVRAFGKKDQQAMDQAIKELDAALAQTARLTGQPVGRDWFTASEAEDYALTELGRRRQAARGQAQPRAGK